MKIETSDGKLFEISNELKNYSSLLMESNDQNILSLTDIHSTELEKVINYMEYLHEVDPIRSNEENKSFDLRTRLEYIFLQELTTGPSENEKMLTEWENKFLNINDEELIKLYSAAYFFKFQKLFDLCELKILHKFREHFRSDRK